MCRLARPGADARYVLDVWWSSMRLVTDLFVIFFSIERRSQPQTASITSMGRAVASCAGAGTDCRDLRSQTRGAAADMRQRATHELHQARNDHRLFQELPQGHAGRRVRQAHSWRGVRKRLCVRALQLQAEWRSRPDVESAL